MDEGAAFGFFPQLRPRRRLQDPTASADVPLQVLRGRLAGLLGLPADIGNLIRSPMPMEMFGDYEYEKPPQLPYTTEYFLKELPLATTSPVGQLAGQAASFVPLNPAPLVRGAQKLGTMVGEGMAERVATGRPMLPSLLAEPQSAMFAVEPNVPRMNLLDTPPETMTSLLEVKPQAAVSDLGFYSAAEQAALNLQRNKGSGQAFLNDLLKAENVKKDELQWMGVDDFLKEKPNVTKQEVQDFIANNRVDVQEVRLGEMPFEDPRGIAKRKEIFDKYEPEILRLYDELDNVSYNDPTKTRDLTYQLREIQDLRNSQADAAYTMQEAKPAKYDQYQLPGGENYREILLTLPEKTPSIYPNFDTYFRAKYSDYADPSNPAYSMAQKDARRNWDAMGGKIEIDDFSGGKVGLSTGNYQSSHFDEPNILAHIRVNDRVDADGKKMLLIEEIQSDWHQAGREKGYKTGKERNPADVEKELTVTTQKRSRLIDEAAALPDSEMTKFIAMNEEIKALSEQAKKLDEEWTNLLNKPQGVPDAPFKDTWYQLALKRVLKHAADNGYERVGLTTGKQQADRFDLSKQISKIYYSPPDSKQANKFGTVFKAFDSRGHEIINKAVTPEELPGIVGKEVAEKLLDAKGNEMGVKALDGIDLQVGGEGMKKYYDEIYPKFLDKYGKKWNARVGETQISTGDNAWNMAEQIKMRGISDAQWRAMSEADKLTLWNEIKKSEGKTQESIRYIDITPEMKGAVSKGQPLFAATPALPLGAQGLLGEPEKKKELSLLD